MAYEFKLPDLGEGVAEGEIARWLVEVGQEVSEDDPLVEIQTDKTTVEIPSPAEGVVARILVAEGQQVPVGTPLVVIGDGDVPERPADEPREPAADATPAQKDRPGARPKDVSRRLRSSAGSRPRRAWSSHPFGDRGLAAGSPRRTCERRRPRLKRTRPGDRHQDVARRDASRSGVSGA